VVLIDMKLPQTSGTEVLRLVRDANPQARTVLITGWRAETERAVQQALDEGANAICYKPFDMNELLKTLGELAR
jgi:DNA-binding response OmpR family regulator